MSLHRPPPADPPPIPCPPLAPPGRLLAQVLAGGLAGGALLAVFAGVVGGWVRQAESGHRAQAALAEATWRCHARRVRAERDACRCALQPPSTTSAQGCSVPETLSRSELVTP